MTLATIILTTFFVLVSLPFSIAGCTPIFEGCICQTKNLSCTMLDTIAENITYNFFSYYTVSTASEMQKDPAHLSRAAGELIGSVVRLVFHDAAEYDPVSFATDKLRTDGCVHVDHPDNDMGINIAIETMNTWWKPWCSYISRADFWVLAAQTMMTETCPYSNSRRGNKDGHVLVYDPTVNRRRQLLTETNLHNYHRENQLQLQTSETFSSSYHPLLAPRHLLKGASRHEYVIFPFRYGRIDRVNCSYTGTRLPSAEKGPGEIVRSLMKNLGLTEAQTVALIGAHTLGAAAKNRSGYNESMWKDRSDLWDITYYKILATKPFTRNPNFKNPHTGQPLQEWDNLSNAKRNVGSFMLNTDMQLVFHIDPSNSSVPTCNVTKPLANLVDPGNIVLNPAAINGGGKSDNCPFIKNNNNFPDFSKYVLLFAEGNTPSEDEPGASRWMSNFTMAWKHITELGYSGDEELQCPQCVNNMSWMKNCPQCTAEETCNGQINWEPLCDDAYPDCPNTTLSGTVSPSPVATGQSTGAVTVTPSKTVSTSRTPSSSSNPVYNLQIIFVFTGLDITTITNAGGKNSNIANSIKHPLAILLNVSENNITISSVGTKQINNKRVRLLLDGVTFEVNIAYSTSNELSTSETNFNSIATNTNNFNSIIQAVATAANIPSNSVAINSASTGLSSGTSNTVAADTSTKNNTGMIIGIVVGIFVGIGLLVTIKLVWNYYHKHPVNTILTSKITTMPNENMLNKTNLVNQPQQFTLNKAVRYSNNYIVPGVKL